MISKLAKSTINIIFKQKPMSQVFNGARSISSFNFSSLEKVSKAQSRLLKAVERESKFEDENYQPDNSVNEFLEKNNLVVKENEDSIYIELHKESGGNKVQIVFQSRSPQMDEEEQQQEEEKQNGQQNIENEEDQQQKMQDYCDFIVYIVKPDGKAIAYDCSSFDSEIQVNGVTLVDNVETHKQGNKFERVTQAYNGPDFNTLDERLQTSLVEYLKSYGVNEEVAAFIEHFSLDKEQRLYMKWLKDVQNLLA